MKPLLIVDGYNVIGAWAEANEKKWPLDECRDRLTHLLQDYGGYTGQEILLVFDGYKADRRTRSTDTRGDMTIVYTRRNETADHYIERTCQLLPSYREARVASSDGVEQTLILGRGATRLSSRELWRELNSVRQSNRDRHVTNEDKPRSSFSSALSAEQFRVLDELRRQK